MDGSTSRQGLISRNRARKIRTTLDRKKLVSAKNSRFDHKSRNQLKIENWGDKGKLEIEKNRERKERERRREGGRERRNEETFE